MGSPRLNRNYLLVITLIARAQLVLGAGQCWLPNGDPSDDVPCGPGAEQSMCCSHPSKCLSSGLCLNRDGTGPNTGNSYARGTCTDKSWKSPLCPQNCVRNPDPGTWDFFRNGVQVYGCNREGYGQPAAYCCQSVFTSKECCRSTFMFSLPGATIGAANSIQTYPPPQQPAPSPKPSPTSFLNPPPPIPAKTTPPAQNQKPTSPATPTHQEVASSKSPSRPQDSSNINRYSEEDPDLNEDSNPGASPSITNSPNQSESLQPLPIANISPSPTTLPDRIDPVTTIINGITTTIFTSPTPRSNQQSSPTPPSGLSASAKIGVILGSVLGVVILILIAVFLFVYRRARASRPLPSTVVDGEEARIPPSSRSLFAFGIGSTGERLGSTASTVDVGETVPDVVGSKPELAGDDGAWIEMGSREREVRKSKNVEELDGGQGVPREVGTWENTPVELEGCQGRRGIFW
ncbi:hypothetical protein QBC40DRAFT_269266 [Triangularia verruculosa]|uniref:Uncharacterized protein n=1 Tax=Triangularia verruculosa TaxID=2587418 RepID=A0AAN6X798_9PEZI|nr:hypothetical protein QBC40DRAFT_269266 [Triangularia verruculosa]